MDKKLDCYLISLIGFGLLGGSFLTLTAPNDTICKFENLVSKDLLRIYKKIVKNRSSLYLQGLILGLIIAYLYIKQKKKCPKDKFYTVALFISITLIINLTYYLLMPKIAHMKDYLKDADEKKIFYNINKEMRHRYTLGIILGVLAILPFSISLC